MRARARAPVLVADSDDLDARSRSGGERGSTRDARGRARTPLTIDIGSHRWALLSQENSAPNLPVPAGNDKQNLDISSLKSRPSSKAPGSVKVLAGFRCSNPKILECMMKVA